MAASGKSWKTNVFWTKDSDDQDEKIVKLHMPGVILEPHSNVKMPMVRKPVHMIKPRVVTLQKSLRNSLERRHGLKEASFSTSLKRNVAGTIPLSNQHEESFGQRHRKEQEKSKKQLSLKELNPQDKKRVANLVKELAKVGEERVHAEERLHEERTAFEERLAILQEEYDAVIKEKHYLQRRFVELQALLVKYQTNGRTPSPRKPVKSPTNEEQAKHQVSCVLSSNSPSKPPHISSSKPELTKVTGNTRPNGPIGTDHVTEKFRPPTRLPLHVTPQVRNNDSVLLNNDNSRQLGKTSTKSSPLHHSSVSSSHARESILSKSNLTQSGQIAAETSSGHLPMAIPTTAEEMPPSHGQSLEISQSLCPREGPYSNSLNPRETSTNTSSVVTAHHHAPSAITPQPAMNPGPTVMSQYPSQAKPVFSVFGDGISEPRIPPRKNEERSFSEASGVSGSFSAELDAVYRLYCREYELQLQLQQQQIELQKQQLQLQQQLQQVETLQQQQHQQQQQQQQQQSTGKSPNYVPAATQAMDRAGHEKHLKTVVEETPAPSPVPRPSLQPRQVSPSRSLIPTPEGSSSILSNGRLLPKADLQTPRAESTVGSYVSRDQAPPDAEVSGTLPRRSRKNRMELEKENRDPLVPDPHGRVMSAPSSLSHSRSNFERHQMPRHQEEFSVPYSQDERVTSGYGRNSMNDDPQTSKYMGGRGSADYHASGLLSSSYSLQSRSRDVSAIRENASLRERKGQDFYLEPDMLNGRASNDLFYSSSNYGSNIDRASSTTERFQTDSFLNGARTSNAQPPFPEPQASHPQMQGSFNRQTVGSDQQFSLYSDVQSRDDMFPDGDVMAYRQRMFEKSQDRVPMDSAYPLSLVDIVDGLESGTEKRTLPSCRDPGQAEGLDTTDSGYSQDTYKERSPLTSESVNTDEEEAAVLEDIFFLTGRL